METILKLFCCIPYDSNYVEENNQEQTIEYGINFPPVPQFMKRFLNYEDDEDTITINHQNVKIIDEFLKKE